MNKIEKFAEAIREHEGWFPNSRSQRNNNPGNFRCSKLMTDLGAIRCDDNFSVFPNYETGWKALVSFVTYACNNELRAYKNKTIYGFFEVYAPSGDKNNPRRYAEIVAKAVGVSPETKMSELLVDVTYKPMHKRFVHPIDKVFITQRFGERPEVYQQFGLKGHNGIDYRTRFIDSPLGRRYVVAPDSGVVEEVGNQGGKGYGVFVRIRHDDGSQSVFGHLTKSYVVKGKRLAQGERFALTGNTGFSSGPHLHWGFRPKDWNQGNGYAGYVDQEGMIKL